MARAGRVNRVVGLATMLMNLLAWPVCAYQIFCADPVPSTSCAGCPYVYQVFMKNDDEDTPYYLHRGVDIAAESGDVVYVPTAVGDSVVVFSATGDCVMLYAFQLQCVQDGMRGACELLHVTPSVSLGDRLNGGQQVGVINSDRHLHECVYLSTTTEWGDVNLVNPLIYANDGAPWTEDSENPEIDSVRVVPAGAGDWVWKVYAHDGHGSSMPEDDDDGVYGLQLYVSGLVKDEVVFDSFRGDDGYAAHWDDYYCSNNPALLCYTLTWKYPPYSDTLPDDWKVVVVDHQDWGDFFPDHECLGQCDTWGCIKACYGGGGYSGGGAVASGWPSCVGRASGAELSYPQGVFGKMGGYQLYWPDFDPGAWTYDAWESAEDESAYVCLGTSSVHQGYHAMTRPNAAPDSVYYYSVASLDSVLRDEVPRPGKGSIIGIGQCRLTNVPYCAELDTVNAVLFVGESEGLIDVVDVSVPEAPQILVTYDLSEYGLWQNTFDDICVLRYGDGHLWVVCGNKGVAILQFASDYQSMVVRGRYAIPGWRLSLYGSVQMEPLGGESAPPDESHYYAYYVTTECKVRVLDFVLGGGGYPHIECCGEYEDSLSTDYVAESCYALGAADAPVLYVTGYRLEPSFSGGLSVVDISDPCEPTFVREIDTYSATGFEARAGSNLYVLGPPEHKQEMAVFDVSDPYLPVEQASWSNALFNHDANCNPLGPGRIACSDDRVYFIGNAYVAYPTPNRYGGCACWGGLECFTMCGDAFPMFSAAVTDTGFDMAGDTSLVTTTVAAALGKVYVTYTCDADTNGVPENARNRVKIYADLYQDGGEAGVTTHREQIPACGGWLRLEGPNPFADWTAVSFSVPEVSPAELAVYDVRGRRVRTLADSELLPGVYDLEWDGRSARGDRASPGVYFLHLRLGESRLTCKVILLK